MKAETISNPRIAVQYARERNKSGVATLFVWLDKDNKPVIYDRATKVVVVTSMAKEMREHVEKADALRGQLNEFGVSLTDYIIIEGSTFYSFAEESRQSI